MTGNPSVREDRHTLYGVSQARTVRVDADCNHLRMSAVYTDSTAVYLERRWHLTESPVSGLYIATILILTNSQFCGIIRSYYKN